MTSLYIIQLTLINYKQYQKNKQTNITDKVTQLLCIAHIILPSKNAFLTIINEKQDPCTKIKNNINLTYPLHQHVSYITSIVKLKSVFKY